MLGILLCNKYKKLLLALVCMMAAVCFICFAQRAEAAEPHTLTIQNGTPEYKIRHRDGLTNWNGVVIWDTDLPPDGDGPFEFCVVYDQRRFARMNPFVMGTTSINLGLPVDTVHVIDPIYGEGDYPVYVITSLGENATITADLYCEIKLIAYPDQATYPNSIFSTTSPSGFVMYKTDYTFNVQVEKFRLPRVKSYNTYDNLNAMDLSYTKVNTNAGQYNDKYEFTYNIPQITQNTTIEVWKIVPAYSVQLPDNNDANPEIYRTNPKSGIHVEELGQPFYFDMYFTTKYGDSIPHASVISAENLNVTWDLAGSGSEGENIFRVKIPSPSTSIPLTVSFNKNNWHIMLKGIKIQLNPSYYALNPANGYLQVNYSENGVFYIIPTAAYAHNTAAPTVTLTSGYTATVENQGSQWKCTILGLKHTVDAYINVSAWTADPNAPSGSVSIITMPSGEGYSIANIMGGYALGNNQYRVNNGSDFTFSVNVASGYDPSTLNVAVAGQRLFPANNTYTIPSVNANLSVTISVSKTSAATPTPTGSGSSNSSTNGGNGSGGEDDGELKYREIYDEKLGIMISGFFVGAPKLKITDLLRTDPVYIRMLKSSKATEDKVLRAVDVQILNGTLYGTLTLGLHVGVGYNTIEVLVIHGTSTGDEKYKVLGHNGLASVGVRSLSPFMVVDPDGLGPGAISNTDVINEEGVTIGPPRTGGQNNVMGFILLGIVAGSILFIVWLRKRDVK